MRCHDRFRGAAGMIPSGPSGSRPSASTLVRGEGGGAAATRPARSSAASKPARLGGGGAPPIRPIGVPWKPLAGRDRAALALQQGSALCGRSVFLLRLKLRGI